MRQHPDRQLQQTTTKVESPNKCHKHTHIRYRERANTCQSSPRDHPLKSALTYFRLRYATINVII